MESTGFKRSSPITFPDWCVGLDKLSRGPIINKIRKSVSIFLEGGTGNQLFMYFAALSAAINMGGSLVLETKYIGKFGINHGSFLNELTLNANLVNNAQPSSSWIFINRIINASARRIKLIRHFQEKILGIYRSNEIGYDPRIFEFDRKIKLYGYFQSWRYFEFCSKRNLEKIELTNPTQGYLDKVIEIEEYPTLVVHVRRGDYAGLSDTFGVLDEKYFMKSVEKIFSTFGLHRIWIFSDDINQVRDTFKDNIWSDATFTSFDLSPIETIFLMSRASAFVISNSTFSYWSALLSRDSDKTVAPETWFKNLQSPTDLLPPHWLKVKSVWLESSNRPSTPGLRT